MTWLNLKKMDVLLKNKIKNIRELKNYKQEYIADKLAITQAGYSKIENGKTELTYNKIKKIAQILEVSLEDIIYFDNQRYFNDLKANYKGSFFSCSNNNNIEKLYQDKVLLLEKLLSKTDIELKMYKEKFGILYTDDQSIIK